MVITVRRHIEDEETQDSSSPIESRRGDRKINPSRSKHSETEQRRRSKINERVVHYVQFLKEKLQIYEGSSQEWSLEPAKCFPLRTNSGPVESFVDQSQLDRNFAGHEDNVLDTALLSNVQNMPPIFQGVTGQPHQGSFPDVEQVGHQPRAPLWPGRSCGDDCSIPIYAANEDETKSESGEASMSSVYSQWLLSSLKNSLESSGVDLSQASTSVQLDIGKRTNGKSTNTVFYFKDDENGSSLDYGAPVNISENYEQPPKRFRANQT